MSSAAMARSAPVHEIVPSLFIIKWATDIGYAIPRLERLFFDVGLALSGGALSHIHFAYKSTRGGRPQSLPPGFPNVIEYDIEDTRRDNIARLAEYVRGHRIRFVLGFDADPTHPAWKTLRRNGVQTIVSYWGAPISSRQPAWKLALKRCQIALSPSWQDGLIFESRSMAYLATHGRGVPDSRVDVVPIGVDTTVYRPAHSDYVYRALGLPRDRKVVVYSGHITPRKGIPTLIEAAIEILHRRRRTDVQFVLLGNQRDESAPYEQMYAGLGIDGAIRWGGYRPDLAQIFPSCYCGVIASSGWDSFTYSAVEMAACGLPVIASRLQGLAEAVLDGRTGLLFEPGNAAALADCIERLLDDPGRAAQLGQQGRLRCEQDLNLPRHRERLIAAVRRRLPGAGDNEAGT